MKKFDRVVVIAPTRSTCLNISMVLDNGAIPQTLLLKEKGVEIFEAVDHLGEGGFGVVAGTGTGKTVAIRDIAKRTLAQDLQVDVVTRENEATDYTWTCNVLVVTPGVALHWFKNHVITATDLVVVDEIHQTSEHLELSLALSKRNSNTVVWMSATIDPAVYQKYLVARTVISCSAFDPKRRAAVEVSYDELSSFLDKQVATFIAEERGVAVFVPTRAMAEQMAKKYGESTSITCDFYHGGEKAEKLRQFIKGEVPRPFMIFMTSAGASSLNIAGLDTVVIVDQIYKEVIHSGVPVLEKTRLGNNDLLQMGGRVNGRAIGGKIFILSNREIDFHSLKPEVPEFVLGGDLEHVALVCARLGVELSGLDLITEVDKGVYAKFVKRFKERGIITENGTLTRYGREVEHLPVTPAWAEILIHAKKYDNQALLNLAVVIASIESLYSLIRKEAKFSDVGVSGSDHLTAYNIVALALAQFGQFHGSNGDTIYGFRGDYVKKYFDRRANQQTIEKGIFIEWCDQNGFNGKAIKEATLAMRSIFRQMDLYLPHPQQFAKVTANSELEAQFVHLLAKVQSLDYVRSESNSQFGTVWAAQHSRTTARNVLGTIRPWKDRRGYTRHSIEGTEIPEEVMNANTEWRLLELTRISDGSHLNSATQTYNHGVLGYYEAVFCGVSVTDTEKFVPDEVVTSPEWLPKAQENFLDWLAGQMTI